MGINYFLPLHIRMLDLPISLVLIVSTWKYPTLSVLEVFNLLKLLPHLHLEAFLEEDQSCMSNREIVSNQWAGLRAAWEPKTETLPTTADATNFRIFLKETVWVRADISESRLPSAQADVYRLPRDCKESLLLCQGGLDDLRNKHHSGFLPAVLLRLIGSCRGSCLWSCSLLHQVWETHTFFFFFWQTFCYFHLYVQKCGDLGGLWCVCVCTWWFFFFLSLF